MHTFAVWAPYAGRVELHLRGETRSMSRAHGGVWELQIDANTDETYAFCIDGGKPLPDPRSPFQPAGVHSPSRLVDHRAFRWQDTNWSGLQLETAVLYELHVGTFTEQGTFDSAIDRLDHLVDLGVDGIEVMPIAEFSGGRGWGYDGVDLWAPYHVYGGPNGFKRFVDACHRRGIGVVLDVVYNHLGPEGNYLDRFGPYFSERHQTPWGKALDFDGAESRHVRDFVIENALMWCRDYHVDGLRLDAVHAIDDRSPVPIVAELTRRICEFCAAAHRSIAVIAEKPRIDPVLLEWGVDAQWADDFHHALHALLTAERSGPYASLGSVRYLAEALDAPRQRGLSPGRLVNFAQNHDQVGNRAHGDRLSHLVNHDRLRLAAALTLLPPSVPLLFMGEEWAASSPFLFFSDHQDPAVATATRQGRVREFAGRGWESEDIPDPQAIASFERSKLDWSELEGRSQRSLFAFYRQLIRRHHDLAGEPLVIDLDESAGLLTLQRGSVMLRCDMRHGRLSLRPR